MKIGADFKKNQFKKGMKVWLLVMPTYADVKNGRYQSIDERIQEGEVKIVGREYITVSQKSGYDLKFGIYTNFHNVDYIDRCRMLFMSREDAEQYAKGDELYECIKEYFDATYEERIRYNKIDSQKLESIAKILEIT